MPPPGRNSEGSAARRIRWRRWSGVMTICVLLVVATLGVDLVLPWGGAVSMLYAVAVLVTLRSQSRQLTIRLSIVCSLVTILGFFYSPPGGMLWMALVNRTLALVVLWGIALLAQQQRVPAAGREQMMGTGEETPSTGTSLRGFLPICASCKNVRDDRGSWHQIEVYISAHSEVEFTHSICPDCIRNLSPEHC